MNNGRHDTWRTYENGFCRITGDYMGVDYSAKSVTVHYFNGKRVTSQTFRSFTLAVLFMQSSAVRYMIAVE